MLAAAARELPEKLRPSDAVLGYAAAYLARHLGEKLAVALTSPRDDTQRVFRKVLLRFLSQLLRDQQAIKTLLEQNPGLTATAVIDELEKRGLIRPEHPLKLILHRIPSAPQTFTGRVQELDDLLQRIAARGGAAAVIGMQGLQGQGGVGKTALILRFAEKIRAEFPDGQFFLDLHGYSPDRHPLPPAAFLAHVVQRFHPEARLPEEPAELPHLYRECLAGKRVLLIADNIAPQPGLEILLPPPGSLLLLTSRATLDIAGLDPVRIGTMREPDAFALLRRLCPRSAGESDEALRPLAHRSGWLAVALEANARTLHTNRLHTIASLCALLEGEKALIEPVRAACQISYDHLADAALRTAWRQLAVFSADFDIRAAAAVWACDEAAAPEILGQLDAASLVILHEKTGRLSLHDLARQFADGQFSKAERDAARIRHAAHYRAVGAEADSLYMKGDAVGGLALFDRERTQIEAAFACLAGRKDKAAATVLLGLVDAVVYTSDLRFHPRQRIAWLEAQLTAARLTKDRQQEGNALGNLGAAHATLGAARKAIEYYEQRLVIAREISDRRGEGTALGNLGLAHADLGDARKAIGFYEQQLVIAREIGDRRGEGNALGNLGVAHAALGDARKAIEVYEQQLVIAREIGDRRGEGNALWNSAGEFWKLGKRPEAIARGEAALRLFEAIESPHAAKVRATLAELRAT